VSGAPGLGHDRGEGRDRLGLVSRVLVVLAVCAVFTGILAVTRTGPFTSAPPAGTPGVSAPTSVRGTWLAVLNYRSSSTVDTVHVTSDDRTTGVFAGTVDSAVGNGSITGKVTGYAVRFTISIGLGAESATATVTSDGRTTTINGDFANATGGSGTITATRVSR